MLLALVIARSLLFIDFVAAYYATAVLVDLVSFATGQIVNGVLSDYLTGSQAVSLAAIVFLASIVLMALFMAAGYVSTLAFFLVPIFAGISFIYTFFSYVFRRG